MARVSPAEPGTGLNGPQDAPADTRDVGLRSVRFGPKPEPESQDAPMRRIHWRGVVLPSRERLARANP